MTKYLEEIHFDDVGSLLEHLRPGHALWRGSPSLWLYRGQGSASWPLAPRVFRPKWAWQFIENLAETDATGKYPVYEQVQYEARIFEEFVRLSDSVGLLVPGTELVLDKDSRPHPYDNVTWPPREYHQALGLAQHSGVPTRLLDVTSSALIAAYFAASTCESKPFTRFAVWAINRKFVELTHKPPGWNGVKHVEVPAANNPFLRVQRASFLLDLTAREKLEHGYPTIDRTLLDQAEMVSNFIGERRPDLSKLIHPPIVYKLTGPSEAKAPLLKTLNDEGVNEIRLKPSFENVARNIVAPNVCEIR